MKFIDSPPCDLSDHPIFKPVGEYIACGDWDLARELLDSTLVFQSEASLALDWSCRLLCWQGQFAPALALLDKRVFCGVPFTHGLFLRRELLRHIVTPAAPSAPDLAIDPGNPYPGVRSTWLWLRLMQSRAGAPWESEDFWTILRGLSIDQENHARLLADPGLQGLWKPLPALAAASPRVRAAIRQYQSCLENLARCDCSQITLGATSFFEIAPEFGKLFRISIEEDCARLDPACARNEPELYARFSEKIVKRIRENQALIGNAISCVSSTRENPVPRAEILTDSGYFTEALELLLRSAADGTLPLHRALESPRLGVLRVPLRPYLELEARMPGAIRKVLAAKELHLEPERAEVLIAELEPHGPDLPVLTMLRAYVAFGRGRREESMRLFHSLLPDLHHFLYLNHIRMAQRCGDNDAAAESIRAMRPNFQQSRDFREQEKKFEELALKDGDSCLLRYFNSQSRVDPEEVRNHGSGFRAFATIYGPLQDERPALEFYRVCHRVSTIGEVIRKARKFIGEVMLEIAFLSATEGELRIWCEVIGLDVVFLPDIGERFNTREYIEDHIPKIFRASEPPEARLNNATTNQPTTTQ